MSEPSWYHMLSKEDVDYSLNKIHRTSIPEIEEVGKRTGQVPPAEDLDKILWNTLSGLAKGIMEIVNKRTEFGLSELYRFIVHKHYNDCNNTFYRINYERRMKCAVFKATIKKARFDVDSISDALHILSLLLQVNFNGPRPTKDEWRTQLIRQTSLMISDCLLTFEYPLKANMEKSKTAQQANNVNSMNDVPPMLPPQQTPDMMLDQPIPNLAPLYPHPAFYNHPMQMMPPPIFQEDPPQPQQPQQPVPMAQENQQMPPPPFLVSPYPNNMMPGQPIPNMAPLYTHPAFFNHPMQMMAWYPPPPMFQQQPPQQPQHVPMVQSNQQEIIIQID